jgi:ribosomal protein S27AE
MASPPPLIQSITCPRCGTPTALVANLSSTERRGYCLTCEYAWRLRDAGLAILDPRTAILWSCQRAADVFRV